MPFLILWLVQSKEKTFSSWVLQLMFRKALYLKSSILIGTQVGFCARSWMPSPRQFSPTSLFNDREPSRINILSWKYEKHNETLAHLRSFLLILRVYDLPECWYHLPAFLHHLTLWTVWVIGVCSSALGPKSRSWERNEQLSNAYCELTMLCVKCVIRIISFIP